MMEDDEVTALFSCMLSWCAVATPLCWRWCSSVALLWAGCYEAAPTDYRSVKKYRRSIWSGHSTTEMTTLRTSFWTDKVHVWAGISLYGRAGICFFTSNMDQCHYVDILEKMLVPFVKDVCLDSHWFMADNDQKHTLFMPHTSWQPQYQLVAYFSRISQSLSNWECVAQTERVHPKGDEANKEGGFGTKDFTVLETVDVLSGY